MKRISWWVIWKKLQKIGNFLPVSNNFCGKLISSWESLMVFDESFRIVQVGFFVADLNLLSRELD